ncbi:WD repeat-containing protein [Trichinella spiralis]|uniref:WD repeat-containing protein n=1 Tax=Trichinella spiralis TaxID=6334 RepID=A0ABR3KK18_TRISP
MHHLIVKLNFRCRRYAFAVGCVDGSVRLLHLEGDNQSRTISQRWRKRYKAAVRGCKFAVDGNSLYVVSKNLALCQQDLQSGSKMRCIQIAHNHAPYSLYPIDQHLIATGDENGVCKIWDWRLDRKPAVAEFHECVDFVSDFVCDVAKTTLLFTSGDATLTAVDLRTMKPICQSEEMHTELLSLVIAMQGKRVLCSSGNGYLEVFNWDQWGTIVERLDTGHQDSVEDLCLLDDRLLASASLDGSPPTTTVWSLWLQLTTGVYWQAVVMITRYFSLTLIRKRSKYRKSSNRYSTNSMIK